MATGKREPVLIREGRPHGINGPGCRNKAKSAPQHKMSTRLVATAVHAFAQRRLVQLIPVALWSTTFRRMASCVCSFIGNGARAHESFSKAPLQPPAF